MQRAKKTMRSLAGLALLPLWALTLTGLVSGGMGSALAASEETVHLGAKHVHIIRGDSIAFNPATSAAEADGPTIEPLSGTFGWFLDHKNDRFGNCFRLSTGEYRGWRIQCVWKDLP